MMNGIRVPAVTARDGSMAYSPPPPPPPPGADPQHSALTPVTPAGTIQLPAPAEVNVTTCWLSPDDPGAPQAYGTGVPAVTASEFSRAYSPPPPPPPRPAVVRVAPAPPAPMHSAWTVLTPRGGHQTPDPVSSVCTLPVCGCWNWALNGVRAVPAAPMIVYTTPRWEAGWDSDGG